MELIIIILIILYFVRKRNKRRLEAEQTAGRSGNTVASKNDSPERAAIKQAWSNYMSNKTDENREAYFAAVNAAPEEWDFAFRNGVYYDLGAYGFPFSMELATKWYGMARGRAQMIGDTYKINKYFEYYDRPAGNIFTKEDPEKTQLHRVQTALMMNVRATGGYRGFDSFSIETSRGSEKYPFTDKHFVFTNQDLQNLFGNHKYGSKVAMLLLQHFDARNDDPRVNGAEDYETTKQLQVIVMKRFSDYFIPMINRLNQNNPDDAYDMFLLMLMILEGNTPYLDMPEQTFRRTMKSEKTEGCMSFINRVANQGGCADAFYYCLKHSSVRAKMGGWNEEVLECANQELMASYILNLGWNEGAEMMRKEFFPNTTKEDWMILFE